MRSNMPRMPEPRALKFEALASDLRRAITAGTWPLGSRLPTEQQFVESTGYSLSTVRRAIDILTEEGVVERRQGSGMYVEGLPRRKRGSLTIGVLIPDTSLYFPRVLQGIEAGLSDSPASLTLATYGYDAEVEKTALQKLLDSGVDGLLITPLVSETAKPDSFLERLEAIPVPTVLVERRLHALDHFDPTEFVCSNHEGGVLRAVTHLHSMGHRRIALCTRIESAPAGAIRRGYDEAPRYLDALETLVISKSSQEWVRSHADGVLTELLAAGATATVVFGDREATLLEIACQRRGIRVPEDLAIVSYDDELADVAPVPLTAVAPAKHRVGRMAANLLLARIAEGDQSPVQQISIIPRLVVRESCGAAKQSDD